jgi:hypothetical protein
MRSGARSSWSVRERDNGPFLNALYVREAFGLAVGRDIPTMKPAVPFWWHVDTDLGDWDRWWQAIVDAGPEIWFVPPSTGPSLLVAHEQVVGEMGRWRRCGCSSAWMSTSTATG